MCRVVKKVSVEFDDGCKVERIRVNVGDMIDREQEYSVEVTRDGVLYSQTEGLDFFEYSELYHLECKAMREYLSNKPKQGSLKL